MSRATATNLKILATVIVTLGIYTWVSTAIPQLESEVPEAIDISDEATPEELVAAGEELYGGAGGCTACHGTGTRAPNLLEDHEGTGLVGERCEERVEGQDCREYLYESMVEPEAYLVEGFPPSMPPQDRILDNDQIWAIIAYLQSVGGEVTVTAEDIRRTGDAAPDAAPQTPGAGEDEPAGGGEGEDGEAVALMEANGCFACHTLGDRGTELGPSFDDVGSRHPPERIRRAIVEPSAVVSEGYEDLAGSMPPNFGEILSDEELETIVDFLASQEGE